MNKYVLTIITSCLLLVNSSCSDFLEEKVVSKATMAYYDTPEGLDVRNRFVYDCYRNTR